LSVVSEATLALPKSDWMQQGGRSGRHSEHLGHLLSELQSMQRTFPGVRMVTAVFSDAGLRQRAWDTVDKVVDPEIPVLTIADLGVLRDVAITDGRVEVAITPTYSGCPAMNMITLEIELALRARGLSPSKSPHRAVAGLDHRLDEQRRPPQAQSVRHRAAAGRQLPPCAVRRAAGGVPAMRLRGIPKCCRNSVRPPARRCGAAKVAANRSTISNVIEHVVIDTRVSIASPSAICAANRPTRCR